MKKGSKIAREKLALKILLGIIDNRKLRKLKEKEEIEHNKLKLQVKEYNEKLERIFKHKKKTYENNIAITIKRLIGITREKAVMFDKQGKPCAIVGLRPDKNTFQYKNGEYTIDRDNTETYISLPRYFEKEILYIYSIDNTNPITIKVKPEAVNINPEALQALLNTRQLINLNSAKSMFSDLLNDPKKILFILIAGAIIWIVLSGGLGTGGAEAVVN